MHQIWYLHYPVLYLIYQLIKMATITDLAKKVEDMISFVKQGFATQYASYYNEKTQTTWKIRVANHNANPERMEANSISFIIPIIEEDNDDSYSSLHVAKKSFKSIPGQYIIIDGCNENGESIEELLNYNID